MYSLGSPFATLEPLILPVDREMLGGILYCLIAVDTARRLTFTIVQYSWYTWALRGYKQAGEYSGEL